MLRSSKIENKVHKVRGGVEAVQFLRRESPYASAPRAELLLLDFNMPREDGREVLEEMKRDPQHRRIPTVVLTSSSAEEDLLASYHRHANCCIRKRVDLFHYKSVVKQIENFWFNVVQIPPS